MKRFIDRLKFNFDRATVAEQIIYLNIVVFVLTFVVKALSSLMQWNGNLVFRWFSLPANLDLFYAKPWTLLSYGFLHGDFLHILLNSIVLFYFGNLFLNFFTKAQFYLYYFFGIVFGGLVFLLSYNYLPALKDSSSYLVGASAGVTAILIGITAKIPQYALHFRFLGAIKLWHIAAVFILMDIIQIPIGNTGGHLAHLGGALIGFFLTSQMNEGTAILSYFQQSTNKKKRGPLKTVYKNSKPNRASLDKTAEQKKIDGILDKISNSGYDTLSQEEKDFLFSVGKKK